MVTACDDRFVDVQILQPGACASCHIKALCSAGESAVKTVRAPQDGSLRPGMSVILSMEERMGWLGVLVGFVLPLILMVAVLFLVRARVAREEIAGLTALLSLVPYYIAVHAARDHFARIVHFTVQKEGIS